jgi:invasion protein IalB
LALAASAFAAAPSARAEDTQPTPLVKNGDWTAYTYTENGGKVCYMSSEPTAKKGNYTKRDDVYMMVTHRPASKSLDVVSITTGYTYKPDSQPTVTLGKKNFSMFVKDDSAWAPDAKTDRDLVDAMTKGSTLTVDGVSSRGTKTTDTYSLSGFSATYKAISDACGVKR